MKPILLAAVVLAFWWSGVTFAQVEWKRHPHLHKAHEQIEHAKNQLGKANDAKKTEFGGHRAKAIELLNQAQQEVEEAVTWADSNAK